MPYYDTGAPTPNTKNSITKTATNFGIRDFLLTKNIHNPIKYPYLSTSINGAPRGGEPFLDTMVGSGVVLPQISISISGLRRYSDAIIMNRFKDTDLLAPSLVNITNITTMPIFPVPPNGTVNYQQEDITKYGILPKSDFKEYRKLSTMRNLYLDATKQIDMADYISLQPIISAQQLPSYLDEYGNLNLGDNKTIQNINTIGSLLNVQGLVVAKAGIVTNYDIISTLAGRVLTATGLIKDTKLGVIGGQQLALALSNNAAFNTEQYLLGKLNVSDNILSLVKGGTIGLRPDYKITIPNNKGGKILDVASRILGFNIPKSYLDDDGSLFSSENGNISNILRANVMLKNTGNGQITALLNNVVTNINGTNHFYDSPDSNFSPFRSGYAPGYRNHNFQLLQTPKGYAFMNEEGDVNSFVSSVTKAEPIPEINTDLIAQYGFLPLDDTYGNGTSNINQPTFSWGAFGNTTNTPKAINENQFSEELLNQPKHTLLYKTQLLFNSKRMKTIVSSKGDLTIQNGSQTQSSVVPGGGISKGSAVLSANNFDINGQLTTPTGRTAENTFCRSWTTYDRYDSVNNLIRSRGLNQSEETGQQILGYPWRLNTENSVLDDNGFVKIGPYKGDNMGRKGDEKTASPKRYMFSIENLAWAGTPAANLLPCEQGPGDLLSGKFGKIMWFPPYDLTFSESSSVNLESTNFIGRGEPIYTYNNTERTGNLSFKIIIDHSSITNSFGSDKEPDDEFVRSWFAGCVDLDNKWSNKLTENEKSIVNVNNTTTPPKKNEDVVIKPDDITIYFENDITKIVPEYENGDNKGVGQYTGEPQQRYKGGPFEKGDIWPDKTDWGLNVTPIILNNISYSGWNDTNYITALKTYLKDKCPTCKARCVGYASSQGVLYSNNKLAKDRAETLKQWLISNEILDKSKIKQAVDSKTLSNKDGKKVLYLPKTLVDNKEPKLHRYAKIIFYIDSKTKKSETPPKNNDGVNVSASDSIKQRYYTECDFFEKIKRTDPFVYDQFKTKIKYFHPAFHSTTPEGFNSRLTFLLQCTRQGATISSVGPKNLAFGPAPVCILRIGDFYNTKIMMDNVTFDFDPLVWDLNPEGIGVQPMIANVTISFKYIGGSSLYSPINKLQNALSFNYFANTQTFDPRADTVVKAKNSTRNDIYTNTIPEDVYELNKGVDPTKDSLDIVPTLKLVEPTTTTSNNSEVTKADNAVSGKQPSKTPDNNKNIKFVINSLGSHVFNPVEKCSGDMKITITFDSELEQDYNFKFIIFDFNNKHNVQIGSGKLTKSNLSQEFTFKYSITQNKNIFVFNQNNPFDSNLYQYKLNIIGLNPIVINHTI